MGRRKILFVDNEAACASLTECISGNTAARMLVYSLWAVAAQYDSALWTEHVPTQDTPADLPPRDGQLSLRTEPNGDLATLDAVFCICDLSRAIAYHAN